MGKGPSLVGNVAKAKAAAKVAQAISGKASLAPIPDGPEYETVSYNLPLELIDLYRDLAAARHRIDQAAKREQRRGINEAKRQRLPAPIEAPTQARQSASAVVREAMEANADTVQKEIGNLL